MLLLGVKNTASQTLLANGIVNLGAVYRKYCKKNCGIGTFAFNGNSISLNRKGIYHLTLTAIVAGTVAGNVTLQLAENGVLVPGALATQTITTANTELRTLTIDYYFLVDDTCILGNDTTLAKTITVVNTGVGSTISNIVVNVDKVL
ncbi:MAG: spore surface glycoprotein [Podoviridae sp. ctcf755]|nr:MAG: spore surface glycoprotein [Podoviridae sp. ctcf755]